MKKILAATAIAAGALGAAGTASAQDIGSVISNILGIAGVTQQAPNSYYVDQYGRQVYVDQYGRHLLVQNNTYGSVIVGYDQWGRPVYGNNSYSYSAPVYSWGQYAQNRSWDYDGDGVSNSRDRWPTDPRYR